MKIDIFKKRLSRLWNQNEMKMLISDNPFLPSSRSITPNVGVVPKESSVVILIWEESGEIYIAFTQRGKQLRHHPGQLSFPGGKRDPEDISLIDTAIRELKEETSFILSPNSIIGQLSSLYISVSNFNLTPYIAVLEQRPDLVAITEEVEDIFYIPISTISSAEIGEVVVGESKALAYLIQEEKLWGATAMIVHELLSIVDLNYLDKKW